MLKANKFLQYWRAFFDVSVSQRGCIRNEGKKIRVETFDVWVMVFLVIGVSILNTSISYAESFIPSFRSSYFDYRITHFNPLNGGNSGTTRRTLENSKVGVVIKYTNEEETISGNQDWYKQQGKLSQTSRPEAIKIESMQLLTPNVGWVLTQKRLLWTTSGGKQWDDITPPGVNTRTFHAAFFLDVSTGWLLQSVRKPNKDNDVSLEMAITSDGGRVWSIEPLAASMDYAAKYFGGAASISFVDALHGWVMVRLISSSNFSQGVLFTTSDGGYIWTKLPDPPIGDSVRFITVADGWLAGGPGDDKLYMTRDGGNSWEPQTLLPPSATYKSSQPIYDLPTFQGSQDGVLPVTFTGPKSSAIALYITHDRGETWRPFKVLSFPDEIGAGTKIASSVINNDIVVAPSIKEGITVIKGGGKEQSTTKLNTLSPDAGIIKVDFVNSAEGWLFISVGRCAGFKTDCKQESKLFSTIDGGQTLTEITPYVSSATSLQRDEAEPSYSIGIEAAPGGSTRTSQNKGFDKCAVGTVNQMQTWLNNSPYRDTNAYIGGENRSCAQSNLDATWIDQVSTMGWGLIPTWVGPQAPCTSCSTCSTISSDPASARARGITEADNATNTAAALGLTQGTIIYYDMEKYDETNSTCRAAVNAFVDGWVQRMHSWGNKAGVYGSPYNASDWATIANPPDAVWIAKWDGRETVWGLSPLSDDLWVDHQRIHQYQGGHNETWGGITFNIDNDISDGPVAGIPPDTTLPTVNISSPCSSSCTSSISSITVSGSVTDSGGSGLDSVYVLNSTNGSIEWDYSVSGSFDSFSVAGISLELGSNTIEAKAYDGAGNVSSEDIIYVTYMESTHTLDILSGPDGNPNPVIPRGTANLSVTAVDSLGHGLTYAWSASCPNLSADGTFQGSAIQSPTWISPENNTGTQQSCTIQVIVSDGVGLSQQGEYIHNVSPGGVTSLSIIDGIRLLEPPPYPLHGKATVDAAIENIGGATVVLRRIQAIGSFKDRFGYVFWRNWPAEQFPSPLSLAPGESYRYTKLLAENFPDIASTATVMIYAQFDNIPGQDPVTNFGPGATAQLLFEVGHTLTITSGPSSSSNPMASGGTVNLSVNASDSLGHNLSYAWTGSCLGLGSNGSFSNPNAQNPTWTAPENTTGSQQNCTIQVTVNDGQGLDDLESYIQSVTPDPHTLTVNTNGNGTVTSNPEGINCGFDCSETYPHGTVVTLDPTPDAGSSFGGWSGNPDCSDGQVTMDANKTCTANFDLITPETACFDNIDNDNDGLTDCSDPDCNGTQDGPCDTGNPGICAAGTLTCSGGTEVCEQDNQPQQEGPPGDPSCSDGLDNDCDGATDGPDSDCQVPNWPTISATAICGSPDEQVILPVSLDKKGQDVATVGFTINYPSDKLCVVDPVNDVTCSPAAQVLGFSCSAISDCSLGTVQVVVSPPIQPQIPELPQGEIVEILFQVDPNAETGPEPLCTDQPPECIPLPFSSVDCGNTGGQNISCTSEDGCADLVPCLQGDCNGDGVVTTADVTCTILRIFDAIPQASACEDCNGDGQLTTADVTCGILCIFGQCPII